jgi:hypothetical protein
MTTPTFLENMALVAELWPKFQMDKALRDIVYEKWQALHQDKLRDCIRQHRLERDSKPDIAAIHKRYCAITGQDRPTNIPDASRTRRQADRCMGPTPEELEEWEAWAEELLATASDAEIRDVHERLGLTFTARRFLAIAVEYCRKNPPLIR